MIDEQVAEQPVRPRSKWRWIPVIALLPAVVLFRLHPWDRPVKMTDARALALTMDVKRPDGLTYRGFVEARFRKARCGGQDPGRLTFSVMRTGGTYEFIRIVAGAWDSDGRCSRASAVIAGIPLARSWDAADYPDYRGHLGEVFAADEGMDNRAEPTWLMEFRHGDQP